MNPYVTTLRDYLRIMSEEQPHRIKLASEHCHQWYPNALRFCVYLSETYNIELDKCIGIVAAFSIRQRWSRNQYSAELFIRNWLGLTEELPRCFGICIRKSEAIMLSDGNWTTIIVILNGRKITRFAITIKYGKDAVCAVIDTIMLKVFGFWKGTVTDKQYLLIEEACMIVADSLGWEYSVFQTYVWIIQRGKPY